MVNIRKLTVKIGRIEFKTRQSLPAAGNPSPRGTVSNSDAGRLAPSDDFAPVRRFRVEIDNAGVRSILVALISAGGTALRTLNLIDCFPVHFSEASRKLAAETITIKIGRIEFFPAKPE